MFFVGVDYKQTVILSFAVTVDIQCQGKIEQDRIVVIGLKHSCLHTMAQLDYSPSCPYLVDHVMWYRLWHGVSGSILRPVLGNLDELLEEVGGQGVFLAWPLWPMQLAVILDIHALAWVGMVLIILLVVIQFHIHPVRGVTNGHALSMTAMIVVMVVSINDDIDTDITAKINLCTKHYSLDNDRVCST